MISSSHFQKLMSPATQLRPIHLKSVIFNETTTMQKKKEEEDYEFPAVQC